MKPFNQFFLEYRHNLADGTPAPSLQAHNGKNPNIIDKKILHTVGDYKPKIAEIHKPGTIFIGPRLTTVLLDYGLEFKDGKTSQIKNSPNAIQMFINPKTNQPTGRIVQTKIAPVK